MPKLINHGRRREEIAEATWRVIHSSGISGVSIRTVAAEAGLSTGSIRHVFPSRADLITHAMELVGLRARDRISRHFEEADPRARATRVIHELLPLDPERRIEIVGRREFLPTNRSLYPDEWAETIGDIRRHWYLIARAARGQYINIDLTEATHGQCYDNRHNDRYAPAIAHNFTELLALLYHRQGDIWYWLYNTYRPNGDPHDMPFI